MAQLQFAYEFNGRAVAERWRPLAADGAPALFAALQVQAGQAVKQPGATLAEALVAIRYSPDWLGGDPEEADLEAKQLLICLLAQSVSTPSLGRQGEPPYHVVLKVLLDDAGWSPQDVSSLLRGDRLTGVLDQIGLGALSPSLNGLDDLAGWIGAERAGALADRLAATTDYFETKTGRIQALLGRVVPAWADKAASLSRQAYQRALELLRGGESERRSLIVVLD